MAFRGIISVLFMKAANWKNYGFPFLAKEAKYAVRQAVGIELQFTDAMFLCFALNVPQFRSEREVTLEGSWVCR